jgi:YrbI family 3-deoxy-D-manno-octulosonate 8-phosphate phosphatase
LGGQEDIKHTISACNHEQDYFCIRTGESLLKKPYISLENVQALVFDFDGVLTNNFVVVSQDGSESVTCSRSDGLAFDVLRKVEKPVYILSTEKNSVVTARADKLKVKVFQGITNKADAIKQFSDREGFDLKKILYIGNDINDYNAMQLCGYTACPSDSHESIKLNSTIVLNAKGGCGVVRELVEDIFRINFIQVLYQEKG